MGTRGGRGRKGARRQVSGGAKHRYYVFLCRAVPSTSVPAVQYFRFVVCTYMNGFDGLITMPIKRDEKCGDFSEGQKAVMKRCHVEKKERNRKIERPEMQANISWEEK